MEAHEASEDGQTLLSALAGAEKPETETTSESSQSVNQPDESQESTEAEQEAAPASEKEPEQAPASLQSLLEKAGVAPEDFYGMEVPGLEGVTFGDAKDGLQSSEQLQQAQLQQESSLKDRENKLLERFREVAQLEALIPQEARNPQVTEQIKQYQGQQLAREQSLLAEAIPEWNDREVAHGDQKAILDVMTQYGYSAAEVGSIADHRAIKMINDYSRLKAIAAGAEAKQVPNKARNVRARAKQPQNAQAKIEADLKSGKISQDRAATLTLINSMQKR